MEITEILYIRDDNGKIVWAITDQFIDPVFHTSMNDIAALKAEGAKLKFRLTDADDDIYYGGYSVEEIFDPLDKFGAPNAGCATIEYQGYRGVYYSL